MRRICLALAASLILSSPALAETFVCKSVGITDGDTLRCSSGVRVRPWVIQAPERHAPGGPAATRALAAIAGGRDLRCERKGKSYDRVVARCWLGPTDVASAMVTAGHAEDWPRFSGGTYAKR